MTCVRVVTKLLSRLLLKPSLAA
jgi:hypothetical protein